MASQSALPDYRSDVGWSKTLPGIEFEKSISFFVFSPEPLWLGLVASFLKAGGFGEVWGYFETIGGDGLKGFFSKGVDVSSACGFECVDGLL